MARHLNYIRWVQSALYIYRHFVHFNFDSIWLQTHTHTQISDHGTRRQPFICKDKKGFLAFSLVEQIQVIFNVQLILND